MVCSGGRGAMFLVLILKKEHLERSRGSAGGDFIEPPVFCCDW